MGAPRAVRCPECGSLHKLGGGLCGECVKLKVEARRRDALAASAEARVALQQAAPLLLAALIEVGFERDVGPQMECRGCGSEMSHVYDARHGTIYVGDEPGRPCAVGEAMKAVGFRALSQAVAARAKESK